MAALHYAEAVAALGLLRPGGCFVLKLFTFFEHQRYARSQTSTANDCVILTLRSIGLLYLLCCLFESAFISKPATSKSGNSEVYVVCLGFRGVSDDLLACLLGQVSHATPSKCLIHRCVL